MVGKSLLGLIKDCRIAVLLSSPVQAGIVKSHLETFCSLFVCSSGEELFETFERYAPELVILDRTLPRGDAAEEMVRELKDRWDPAVVLATSGDELNWEGDVYPEFVIPKPFNWELLLEMVHQLLGIKRKLHEKRDTVLIADDSPTSRAKLRSLFEAMGNVKIVEAKNGQEALLLLSELQHVLKLATMDLHMPDMDGLEVTHRARRAGVFVPILMVTSEIGPAFVEEAFRKGVTLYISKEELAEGKVHLIKRLLDFGRRDAKEALPVLLVEDSPFMRNLLATQVFIQGYPVAAVGTSEEGLKLLKFNRFLLSIVNLNLPGKSGLEFLIEVHKLGLKEHEKLVMIYTSSQNPLVAIEAFNCGASDFLRTPFNLCDFYIRLSNLIRLRETLLELETSRMNLYNLSVRDELTGLYNRRFFTESLYKTVERAIREKRDFSIMMIDLNGFKAINDTYGHHVGDLVLKGFSDVLKRAVRASDIAARYGGDEFVVLLNSASADECAQVAERIKEMSREIKTEEAPELKFSVSVGCASYSEVAGSEDPAESLLKLADQRMYKDKLGQKKAL